MTPIQIEKSRQTLRETLTRLQKHPGNGPAARGLFPKPPGAKASGWDRERLVESLTSWRETIRQQQQLIDEQAKAILDLEDRLAANDAREKALQEREEAFEASALDFAELVRQFEESMGESKAAPPLTFHGSRAVPIGRG